MTVISRRTRGITSIGISAKFSSFHYGYYSDLVCGVINTALYIKNDFKKNNVISGPVVVRFVSGTSHPTDPKVTSCLNLDPNSRIFEPYFDEEIPSQVLILDRVDEIDDKIATVVI